MTGLLKELNDRRQSLVNKKVVLVVDGAPEHGPQAELSNLLASLETYRPIKNFLTANGGSASLCLLKTPPNSPQLNLCEYYSRTLRTKCNVLRNERTVDAMMLEEVEHDKKKTENRFSVLTTIVQTCMDSLKTAHPQTDSVRKLMQFFKDVIEEKGYLDMHKPM